MDVVWTIIFLGVCSATDIKERKIDIRFCILNMAVMILLHILNGDFLGWNVAGGIMLGGVFFVISKVSKGGIGMGDVFMIGTVACVCGAIKTVEILFWTCAICMLFSIAGIAMRKVNLKSEIPFAPFMLAGNVVFWIL